MYIIVIQIELMCVAREKIHAVCKLLYELLWMQITFNARIKNLIRQTKAMLKEWWHGQAKV